MYQDNLNDHILPIQQANSPAGKCVLYVMSRDQRVQDNHALVAAQRHALTCKLPLAVIFCLYPAGGYRAREHYEFMLAGLEHVEESLRTYGIPLVMLIGNPLDNLQAAMHHYLPEAVYFDMSPLRGRRRLQTDLAAKLPIPMYIVDTHNCVPLWIASQKQEVAAYTLRPKLHKLLSTYAVEPDSLRSHPYPWSGPVQTISSLAKQINAVLQRLPRNHVKYQAISGEQAALEHLEKWISTSLSRYGSARNHPDENVQSGLSPYFHFGQLSSLRVVIRLQSLMEQQGWPLHLLVSPKMPQYENQPDMRYSVDAFLEELVVRKELADNFCWHQPYYDSLQAAPLWARRSLATHQADKREFLYDFATLADGQTHDELWNAAQHQMRSTGKMHGYMRMYWAKKVLEWTESPEQAIDFLVRLNDFYSIDGGDPNGYVGILWSVAGAHDRPWFDRPVYGLVRYMNRAGIDRKIDTRLYIDKYSNKL